MSSCPSIRHVMKLTKAVEYFEKVDFFSSVIIILNLYLAWCFTWI